MRQLVSNMPHTPDCTIIVPVPRADPSAPARRLPAIDSAPRMTLHLHRQCLSAKSILLRDLLSGVSPIDLIRDLSASRRHPPSVPFRVPRNRLPRLLPSPPSHPVLFLPVPDPPSIQPLFHWMYSGDTGHIQNALDRGLIRWEGLARNVEYLCLSTDIKVFLGRWYRNWLLPAQCSPHRTSCPADEDDQSDIDSECDDSDCSEYCSPSVPSTDDELQSDEECDRGRTRDAKPLEQLCGKLRLCTT